MHDCYGRADLRQQQSVFGSRVSTSDDAHIFAGKQLAIARRGFDDAVSNKFLLTRNSQLTQPFRTSMSVANAL